jgi:hypothetical protein
MIHPNLKYFEGKICSVFTSQTARDLFKEDPKGYVQILFRYFMGEIESISESGVIIKQLPKQLRTWVALPHVVAIAEEEVLDPDNPKDAKYIQECLDRAKKVENPPPNALQGQYLNPEGLSKLAGDLKDKFGQ